MVIVVDWDSKSELVEADVPSHHQAANRAQDLTENSDDEDDQFAGTITLFSTALACYPIVLQIASHLDLNSLHDLSATCRQFRFNLLRFRSQLLKRTLRCVNDDFEVGIRAGIGSGNALKGCSTPDERVGGSRMTSGRVGRCARDMVGECRRCAVVVCRNCTIRQPPRHALAGRHRRLCRACQKAPLLHHETVPSTFPKPALADSRLREEDGSAVITGKAFTYPSFLRTPCACTEAVYLCLSCGNAQRSADTTYARGWTWRTRYSTYLGGLGTGIGEGNEGVECGKQNACLAAHDVEKEIDCDAEELAEMKRENDLIESQGAGRSWSGTSYMAQEMEGIGGVVKKKVKRRIKVGATVKEYEDERETGRYLWREQTGLNRSWCCWCSRIVSGEKDLADNDD